jgi:replicative DNA helicase|tara:strand:- start:116 stop:1459 length:1344 start_codon:yes stop_codon:yes gene_type:complete
MNKNIEISKMYSGLSEKAVLGCILKEPELMNIAMNYVTTSKVFYMEDHENIWGAMYYLHKSNKDIDLTTVANFLGEKGFKLTYYLTSLTEGIPTTANFKTHCKTVYDLYLRRQLWKRIVGFKDRIEKDTSYKDVASDVYYLEKISENFTDMLNLDHKSMDGIDDELVESIFAKKNLVQTGIDRIDRAIVGFTKGEISIIAGRPGNGKSTLALNIAKNMILDDKKVLFISREMPRVELVKKLLAMHTQVPNKEMRNNAVNYREEIEKGLKFIKKYYKSLHLFDNLRSLDEGINEAKKIRPDVIIDDHIGFIEFSSRDNRDVRHRIAEITRRYKWLAKELDCSVILVSQLNRNIEHRVDKIPRLSDLAESGNLEQDAEIVIFNYYPYVYEYEEAEHGQFGQKIIIAKNRYGTTCKFDIGFHGDSATIMDTPEAAKQKFRNRLNAAKESL